MKRMLVMLIIMASAVSVLSSLGNREAPPSEREQAVLTVRPGYEFALLRGTDLLTGDEVNASVLTGSKITVITIWATTCSACIVKLPDLAVLEDELPEGVSIIGICLDGSQNTARAAELMRRYGIAFMNLIPHSSMREVLTRNAQYIPATLFVDSSGRLLAGPVYGVRENQWYLDQIASLL